MIDLLMDKATLHMKDHAVTFEAKRSIIEDAETLFQKISKVNNNDQSRTKQEVMKCSYVSVMQISFTACTRMYRNTDVLFRCNCSLGL
jgi:hypothetical protein